MKADYKVSLVKISDIVYLESEGEYVRMHSGRGSTITTLFRLRTWRLRYRRRFMRVHRSYIVNLRCIKGLRPRSLFPEATRVRTHRGITGSLWGYIKDSETFIRRVISTANFKNHIKPHRRSRNPRQSGHTGRRGIHSSSVSRPLVRMTSRPQHHYAHGLRVRSSIGISGPCIRPAPAVRRRRPTTTSARWGCPLTGTAYSCTMRLGSTRSATTSKRSDDGRTSFRRQHEVPRRSSHTSSPHRGGGHAAGWQEN